MGDPIVDPIIALGITILIFVMVFDSARTVFARILDGVAGLTAELRHAGQHVEGIRSVGDIRARSIDHRLHADASIALDGSLSIDKAAKLMARYRDDASHHLPQLSALRVSIGADHDEHR